MREPASEQRDHDEPAVRRTEPEAAAQEGYPIADDRGDEDRARRVAGLAERALAEPDLALEDADAHALAERFILSEPEGDAEDFLGWLRRSPDARAEG